MLPFRKIDLQGLLDLNSAFALCELPVDDHLIAAGAYPTGARGLLTWPQKFAESASGHSCGNLKRSACCGASWRTHCLRTMASMRVLMASESSRSAMKRIGPRQVSST